MMFVKYIDSKGNWNELNEMLNPGWMSRFHKSESGIRYENKTEEVLNSPKQIVEIVEEPTISIVEEIIEEDYTVYKEYLKSKKVKWFGLLKWANIKKKAIENWFID